MSGPPDSKTVADSLAQQFGDKIVSVLPGGRVLTFPKGTDRAVVDRVYQAELGKWMQAENAKQAEKASQPQIGTGESFGIGTTQGLLANFGDEAASAIAATVGRPGGEALPGATWGDRYDTGLKISRKRQNAAHEQHPYAYGAGQVTGAVLPSIVAPQVSGAKYISEAPSMIGMMGRSAAVGAGYGGVQGFGASEGGFENRSKDAVVGGATGAAIGAVVPPITSAIGAGARWAKNQVSDLLWPKITLTEAAPATTMGVADAAATPSASIKLAPSDISKATGKIAEALKRDGYSEDQIIKILDALGPKGTLADVGANTKTLLTSAMGAPGAAKQIGTTALENRQALEQPGLLDTLNKTLGTGAGFHQTDDALLAELEKKASPLYDQAFAKAQPVDTAPVMTAIDKAIAKMPAKSSIRNALERVRSLLGEDVAGADGKAAFTPYDDLETLHNAKLSIDDMLSKYTGDDSLGNVAKSKVMQVKAALLDAMELLNPDYKLARETFSGTMTSRDALRAGREFIKQDSEITAAALADMSSADQHLFREGSKRALADLIKSKPSDVSVVQLLRKSGLLEKVQAIAPSADEFKAFIQDLTNARKFAQTRAYATGGSQTAEKALGAMDLANSPFMKVGGDVASGNKAGLIRSALDWVGQLTGPGEETRAAIVKALLSNDRSEINQTLKSAMIAQALSRAGNQATATTAIGAVPTGALYGNALLGRKGGPR